MNRRSAFRTATALAALLVVATAPARAAGPAMKTVAFRGVTVSVPADWPVYDLAADPARCARLDVHAVYLGAQDSAASCPAMIVGRTETVQLEPWSPGRGNGSFPRRPANVNGEDALVDPTSRAGGTIATALRRARVLLTVTFGADESLADEIASSVNVTRSNASEPTPAQATPTATPTDEPTIDPSSIFRPAAVQADQPTALQPGIHAGEGFDACTAHPRDEMQSWLASPYRAVGIYIGGSSRGCSQPELTASWVADVARMGWSFIPTYVGRQAPCTNYSSRIDPAMAAGQGSSAANDAVTQADLLGLPTGSPIYFDMEAFSYSNTACRAAVQRFLSSWSARLQQRGYLAGVYGSAGSTIRALVDVYNDSSYRRPNAIWNARWGAQEHSVWDDPIIPNTFWANHQRIHQYRGGHNETWGGTTINIDNNFLDGPVVRRQAVQRWLTGDVSADGKTDLVHLCCRDYANTWLSNADSTYSVKSFRPWNGYGIQNGQWLSGDVSGDNKIDLIHLWGTDSANIWISNGDGTYAITAFRPWKGYGLQTGSWLAIDVSGDGKADLVHLCCRDYANVWVSQGNGTFVHKVFKPWAGYGMQNGRWQAGDIDADGDVDLVHLCCRDYAVIWRAQPNGTFSASFFSPWPGYGIQGGSWLVADVDGNSRADLIHLCCGDSFNTWRSNGDGTFSVSLFRPWAGYGVKGGRWLAADVSGDLKTDLVHVCCGDYLNTLISSGNGAYTVSSFQAWPGYGQQSGSWRVGTLDADTKYDLIHLCCDAFLNSWMSAGDGSYTVVQSPI